LFHSWGQSRHGELIVGRFGYERRLIIDEISSSLQAKLYLVRVVRFLDWYLGVFQTEENMAFWTFCKRTEEASI